jgi:calpain-7
LSVHSSSANPCALLPLPADGSGRLSTLSEPAVFLIGTNRILAPLTILRMTKATFVVRPIVPAADSHGGSRASSPIKLTLEQGQGPYKTCLETTSLTDQFEFRDPSAGIRIEDVSLRPEHSRGNGGLWLALQRMAGGTSSTDTEETFQIEVLAEERIAIGPWGRGNG